VARALRTLDPQTEIVGVELDGEVVRLARRHFDLDALGIEVIRADALDHLRRERRLFDLVVEDLFIGPSRSVRKPEGLLEEGYPLIRRRLRPGGYVATNTIHEMPAVVRALGSFQGPVVSLDVRGHWNRIVVCGRDLPPPTALRSVLASRPETARLLPRVRVRSR
jgi:spermidine synthase